MRVGYRQVGRLIPEEPSLTVLIIGLVVFFGVHCVSIVNPAWRDRVAERIGDNAWRGLYSVAAIGGLALLVVGYGLAREQPIILYIPPVWLRNVVVGLMVFVFPLLMAAYIPGRIQTAVKHPMLVAIKLWAVLHLLANGSLADVLLFGSFLLWAVADRIALKRRPPRFVVQARQSKYNDAIAVVAGVGIYAAFVFGAHRLITGIPAVLSIGL